MQTIPACKVPHGSRVDNTSQSGVKVLPLVQGREKIRTGALALKHSSSRTSSLIIQLWVSVVVLAGSERGGFKYALDTEYGGAVEEQSGGCQDKCDTTGWMAGRVVGTTHLVLYTQVSRWWDRPRATLNEMGEG